ncbi:MAG TPA: orotidine-5'-phosphate decarboxylase [Acidimicrobiales bacterium]|nr:orotidine-5'-phosphate decarboxylase [Acidimicrobiales bacterium]
MTPDSLTGGEVAARVRDRLALALDVSSLDEAVELAARLRPWFAVAKVGLELFSSEGPLAVDALLDEGFRVFLDLKLHDIPTTVGRAARRIGSFGVSYTTAHAAGGEEMLRAAVEGFESGWEGAVAAGHPAPPEGSAGILAVTVLTSAEDANTDLLAARALLASRTGCLGVVCAAADLPFVRSRAPGLLTVVPGIRLAESSQNDQARAAEPALAIGAGADLLVIGRTVTGSDNPELAAQRLAAEVHAALNPVRGTTGDRSGVRRGSSPESK